MREPVWDLLAALGLLVVLIVFAKYHRYCCLRGPDDSEEEREDEP